MAVVSRPLKSARAASRARRIFGFGPLATVVTYIVAILAIALLVQQAIIWGQRRIDDVRYGFPRRAHVAGFIGHADEQGTPTHIFTLNIDGQVSALVLPGGNTDNVQVLAGPYLVGQDGPYAVPLPALQDVNEDGQADLLITLRGEIIVYLNEGGTFRLITPEERAGLVGLGSGEPYPVE